MENNEELSTLDQVDIMIQVIIEYLMTLNQVESPDILPFLNKINDELIAFFISQGNKYHQEDVQKEELIKCLDIASNVAGIKWDD